MQPDLGLALAAASRPGEGEPLVGLGRRPVIVRVRAIGRTSTRRRSVLLGQDPLEAPVRVGTAHPVNRGVASPGLRAAPAPTTGEHLVLGRAAPPRTPVRVHFQGVSTSWVSATAKRAPHQRGGSSRAAPQPLDGRVERVERGRRGAEAIVFVPLASRSSTRARWKNASATRRPSAAPRGRAAPRPRPGTSRRLRSHLAAADRVQNPAGPLLHRRGSAESAPYEPGGVARTRA